MSEKITPVNEWLESLQFFGIKLGLEQTRELADRCGAPDKSLRFIHIAGTNGKGSTGAMLERALRNNGFRTGFYSSPHLITVRERVRINGAAVSEDDFIAAAETVKIAAEAMREAGKCPTYFEAMTVLALLVFKQHQCDCVVWETGMGGRLDATNIVDPEVSVITNIAMDHEKYLGSSLSAIAGEKAGIIKPGRPVIAGAMPAEALAVIRAQAAELNSIFIYAPDIFIIREEGAESMSPSIGQSFYCNDELIVLNLKGVMQQKNVQTVMAVLSVLQLWNTKSRNALGQCRWPGRCEMLCSKRILLDGGHNPDGIGALTETLKKVYPGQKFDWVFGAFADKDFSGGLQLIAPLAKSLRAVSFAEGSRLSAEPEKICEVARKLGIGNCSGSESLDEIIAGILKSPESPEVPTVIAGSLYLAGEVLSKVQTAEKVWDI